MELEVVGKIRMTSDINGSATWQDGTSNFSMVSAKVVNGGIAYHTFGSGNWKGKTFFSIQRVR